MRRLLVDEDMPRSTATQLRLHGYEADDVRDVGLRGRPDTEVFDWAQARGAILVTADMGFANVLHYPPSSHGGLIIVRVPNELSTLRVNQEILRSLREIGETVVPGTVAIVEVGRTRVRRPEV